MSARARNGFARFAMVVTTSRCSRPCDGRITRREITGRGTVSRTAGRRRPGRSTRPSPRPALGSAGCAWRGRDPSAQALPRRRSPPRPARRRTVPGAARTRGKPAASGQRPAGRGRRGQVAAGDIGQVAAPPRRHDRLLGPAHPAGTSRRHIPPGVGVVGEGGWQVNGGSGAGCPRAWNHPSATEQRDRGPSLTNPHAQCDLHGTIRSGASVEDRRTIHEESACHR